MKYELIEHNKNEFDNLEEEMSDQYAIALYRKDVERIRELGRLDIVRPIEITV